MTHRDGGKTTLYLAFTITLIKRDAATPCSVLFALFPSFPHSHLLPPVPFTLLPFTPSLIYVPLLPVPFTLFPSFPHLSTPFTTCFLYPPSLHSLAYLYPFISANFACISLPIKTTQLFTYLVLSALIADPKTSGTLNTIRKATRTYPEEP